MLYAITNQGEKILPSKGATAICPDCNEKLIAKCGDIISWHWAHRTGTDCELWGEHESAWHLWWKSQWPKQFVEVPVVRNGKRHRADIRTPDGKVVELQHSFISTEEMHERETFYGDMVWVFDENEKFNMGNMEFVERFSTIHGTYYHHHWKHPRKSLLYARKPVYIDLPEESLPHSGDMFILKHLNTLDPQVFDRDFQGYDYTKDYDKLPFGWGHSYSRKMFRIWYGAKTLTKEAA